jgi:hypothetical protein
MDQKIDIVYILANASKWQNNEIRYSLRSIEKNLDLKIGRIYIVGFMPKFIQDLEVSNIDVQDKYTNKLQNAVRKIKAACNNYHITDRFILMNDDFFIMKKVSEIKYWSKGSLKGSMARHKTKGGYYYKAIKETKELLEGMGIKNPTDYEIHAPIIIEKTKFLEIDKKMNLEEKGLLFRSIYGNLTGAKRDVVPDVKIFNIGAKGMEKYKDYKIISTGNKVVMDPKFQKWLKVKFKKVSKYEKEKIGIYYSKHMFTYKDRTYNPGDLIKVGDIPKTVAEANRLVLVKKSY